MQQDLGLSDSQYETCVSILFVGYILMQIPSNLFLNKVGKPAIYLPAVMVRPSEACFRSKCLLTRTCR